jgi:hypothetical protein
MVVGGDMEEPKTWRELLGQIINNPSEKQRIAHILRIHPVTLQRWTTSQTRPRKESLLPLLNALPQHRQQLIYLLAAEYPSFALDMTHAKDGEREIPSAFYARVLNALISNPPFSRSAAVINLILDHIVENLNIYYGGLLVALTQFVPPARGHFVRSLRSTFVRNTIFSSLEVEHYTLLLGAESQIGQATNACHPMTQHISEETPQSFLDCHRLKTGSKGSFPIIQANQAAGCLHVISPHTDFFTQHIQALLQNYAILLVLAFEDDDFYNLNQIALGVMPPCEQQHPYFARFQERVSQLLIQSSLNKELLTRSQAEIKIWQELEAELLYLA